MSNYNVVSTRAGRAVAEDAALEKEEAEFNKVNATPTDPLEPAPIAPDTTLSDAEQTWQKRYSDLRRHAAKLEQDAKKREDALNSQLRVATEQQIKFPKSASIEDALAWAQEFPDLAGVIEAIADYKVGEKTKGINEQLTTISHDKLQLAKEKAYNVVLKVHPDLPELVHSQHYQDWIGKQPLEEERGEEIGGAIYRALMVNETDAKAAINALNIYKSDLAMETSKPRNRKKEQDAEAATTVTTSRVSAVPHTGGKRQFLESEIEEMNIRQYEKFEKEIEEARQEGRIIYDISAAAR